MDNKKYLTIAELAKILGISRIAVYKKVKKGQIKAQKAGRIFIIPKTELGGILDVDLSKKQKEIIDQAVRKTAQEYQETMKLLEND